MRRHEPPRPDRRPAIWWGFGHEHDRYPSRTAAWCDHVATAYGLPPFAAARPADPGTPDPERQPRPYAVLAPHSAWDSRSWPTARWTELGWGLRQDGLDVDVIGMAGHHDAVRALCDTISGSRYRVGFDAANVRALLAGAAVIVGNDSGVAHLGGLFGVPTVAVHAGSLPHGFLFDCAPSVSSVTATSPVGRGGANAPALNAIPADAVLAGVRRRLDGRTEHYGRNGQPAAGGGSTTG